MIPFLFGNKTPRPLTADVHSHLIPGVDDGVKSLDEALDILRQFEQLGYRKIITTPHIYQEYYPNNEEELTKAFQLLQKASFDSGLTLKLELAAEYYVDSHFLGKVKSNKPLLTFGERYVLIETSFHNRPIIWNELIFELQVQQYKPVLAHPERYQYLLENPSLLAEIRNAGVLLQLSLPSIVGAYGPSSQKFAREMIRNGWVALVGSDLHNLAQLEGIKAVRMSKLYRQLMKGMLINDEL